MGGDGHHGPGITYKGVTLYGPKRWHVVAGKAMGAMAWLWFFYRAKQDGDVLLGLRHPWEHRGEGHHEYHILEYERVPVEDQ